jgi:hypothetical protein
MSYRDPTYVIFDGDADKWAYAYMKGWKENDRIDFDFHDAHDLDTMSSRAQGEAYVKSKLKERLKRSSIVVVLIGKNTKNLFRFVRWELDLALEFGLPIVAVNLNKKNRMDSELCPAIIRDVCAVHVPFRMDAIKRALDTWPQEYRTFDARKKAEGNRYYGEYD